MIAIAGGLLLAACGSSDSACPAVSEWPRDETGCGDPAALTTSGLVAYSGAEPVGGCAVEPRTAYVLLLRKSRPTVRRVVIKIDF